MREYQTKAGGSSAHGVSVKTTKINIKGKTMHPNSTKKPQNGQTTTPGCPEKQKNYTFFDQN